MVTVAVSAPLLHFLERVRVGCGGKGRVLVEVGAGGVCRSGAAGPDLKCGGNIRLVKRKKKNVNVSRGARRVSPPISLWREEPGRSCSRRRREAEGSCGELRPFQEAGPLHHCPAGKNLSSAGEDEVDGSIGGSAPESRRINCQGDVGGGRRRGEADAVRRSPLVRVIWIPSLTNRKKNKNISKELSGQFLSGKLNFRTLPPGALPAN